MPRDTVEGESTARNRSGILNMRIDPKLKYLAEMAAIEQQRSLSGFVEWAIRRALTAEAMSEDEPTYGLEFSTGKSPAPLWNEGLWDVDECDRFYLKATMRHDLLKRPEQNLWKLFTGNQELAGKRVTMKAFREFWHSPSIDTKHLTASD